MALGYTNAVNQTPGVSFAYDAYFPRLTSMTDGNGVTAYSYRAPGNNGALQLTAEDGPFAHDRITYSYDALGRVTQRIIDGTGDSFSYDNLGRVTSHSDPLGTFALSYLGQTNQLARRTLQSTNWDTTWQYGDNLHDRHLAAINHSGLNQPARNYAYTTSPENRILGLTESVASTATETWGYGYDLADRLTSALATPSGAYTYGLDAGDNLLTVQTPTSSTTSTYDNLNQIDLRNAQPFVYDAAGNLLNDGQRTYTWDAEQRLIGIGYLATPAVSTILRYDGLGRRSAMKEYTNSNSYTETRYLWCGERICQARNASDVVIRRYYDEGELQVSSTGNTPLYYAQDHLDSVRDLVNASGSGLASYDYDPYGKPTRSTTSGSARADYRYAGLFYHAPSGLYLTHYRAYDPVTARWLSRDPIGEAGGVNLYGYVEGNPVSYTDPLGLMNEAVGFGGGGVGIGGPSGAAIGRAIGAVAGAGIAEGISGAMDARSHGDGAEARPADVNPGEDCDGKCKPCPPNPPSFDHQGDAHGTDRGSHTHQWQYHQAPDCTCRAQKVSW